MKKLHKPIQILMALVLIVSLITPAALVVSATPARFQPLLGKMAAEQPDEMVRVIAQKADDTDRAERLVEKLGGRFVKDLHIIHAFVAELPAKAVPRLASAVSWVSLDAPVESTGKPVKNPEPDPTPTLPENVYLDTLGVRQVWDMGYDGTGVGVAVIDSGVSNHNDLTLDARISFNPNSNSIVDVNGHGTHVGGIISGNGNVSEGFYQGIAPGVTLHSLKISDETGMAFESDVVDAMQWILDNKDVYNIRVVNLSIQSSAMVSYHESPMDAAAEILWFNGVVVVAAAGNWDGTGFNPIHAAPANDPFIITVGATDEKGTARTRDDVIASFSAYDETQEFIVKPEIHAPGKNIISTLSGNSEWDTEHPDRVVMVNNTAQYFRISGTSMAAPMVAGAAALLLQAEPDLTPDQVKYRLLHTAGSVGKSAYLDVYEALTTSTTESANTGYEASQLLWSGDEPVVWESVNWNSVNWNSVNWNSVNWNSVNWNSVNWNSVNWND